jgi:hypothetical protein
MADSFDRARREAQTDCSDTSCSDRELLQENTEGSPAAGLILAAVSQHFGPQGNNASTDVRVGEFFKGLSPEAISEFESLAATSSYLGDSVLFAAGQEPSRVLFLVEGSVQLTMISIDGRRLTLGIAVPGEILGLTAVLTGCPYEITAVAQGPCRIISLPRQSFLDFLLCYPAAWLNSARLLTSEYKRGCEQLHLFGRS